MIPQAKGFRRIDGVDAGQVRTGRVEARTDATGQGVLQRHNQYVAGLLRLAGTPVVTGPTRPPRHRSRYGDAQVRFAFAGITLHQVHFPAN